MIRILKYIIIILLLLPFSIIGQEGYLFFLNTEKDATDARIKILSEAKEEILISYFIFEDDPIGLIGLDLLLLAKEENPDLSIKLLLDASANRVDKSILYILEQNGIEIREFHPIPKIFVPIKSISIKGFFTALKNFNFRMHDKLIIVDNEKLITGGRNIEKSYYGLDEKNFHDRDLLFHSKILTKKVSTYFHQLWNSKHVRSINYHKSNKIGSNYDNMSNKMKNIRNYINFNKNAYSKQLKNSFLKANSINFNKATFLSSYNKSTDKFDPNFLSTSLYNLTINTNKLMLIETPYLLPTKRFYNLLNHLREKNVKIQFVTNSFCSTDVMPVAAAYDNEKPILDKLGIEIYEFLGPNYLHAKSAVFDDNLTLVGSYNMDPRSAYLNTEIVFIIDDINVAKHMKAIIYNDMENCMKVDNTKDRTFGGFYDCNKSQLDIFTYVLFKFLAKFDWLYNLF